MSICVYVSGLVLLLMVSTFVMSAFVRLERVHWVPSLFGGLIILWHFDLNSLIKQLTVYIYFFGGGTMLLKAAVISTRHFMAVVNQYSGLDYWRGWSKCDRLKLNQL